MLLPNKHSHPDETVLAASTVLLRQLRRTKVVQFDEFKAHLPERDGSAEYLFTPAVSLLFLLGVLEYNPSIDSFIYVGS